MGELPCQHLPELLQVPGCNMFWVSGRLYVQVLFLIMYWVPCCSHDWGDIRTNVKVACESFQPIAHSPMPPSCCKVQSPEPSLAASNFQFTVDENTLLNTAIHMDAAIREFHARDGKVNVEFFLGSMDDEILSRSIVSLTSRV